MGCFVSDIDKLMPGLSALAIEAGFVDPQQRLLLEVVSRIRGCGFIRLTSWDREPAFSVGIMNNDFAQIQNRDRFYFLHTPIRALRPACAAIASPYVQSARPELLCGYRVFLVLVAAHSACSALRNGECRWR